MTHERLRILLVEDDEEDALLIRKMLETAANGSVALECMTDMRQAIERLPRGDIDLVLLDLFLPDSDGLHTLQDLQAKAPDVPIIVITNLDDQSAALEAVNHGAQDYLVKGELNGSFFLRTIRHAIERQRIRIQLNETNARLEQLALIDPLTNLLNRRGLQQILSGHFQRSRMGSDTLALLVDLDDFKLINDTLGHAVGDVVLKEIAQRVKSSLRATDHAARIGGDEFLLLLPETRMAEGIRVAEKVRLAIAGSPIVLSTTASPAKVTASLGLVVVNPSISSIDELLVATHAALAKSKRAGKNQVSYEMRETRGFAQPNLRLIQSQLLETPFRTLQHSIYNLYDGTVVGCEFLSRSLVHHFEQPDDFFRVSLENNILTSVDHECFKTCLNASQSIPGHVRRHFNLFPSTLLDIPTEHLIQEIKAVQKNATPCCIEISEQQIIGDPSYLVGPVEALKEAGILIAVDDVGFGRSCFESLILLEPNIIKIDKGCVTNVAKDKARARSLSRILNVAKVLETEVIAEGIESEEDLNVLKQLGVTFGQGFFLDKPSVLPEPTSSRRLRVIR